MPQDRRLLVCDLDNTLYDWVSYFVPSFYAMVEKVHELTGWQPGALLDDFRRVHQRHSDSEHPFALLETDHVRREFGNLSDQQIVKFFDPAFHAFNSARKKNLALYPRVLETMEVLQRRGVSIVAHTESKTYSAVDRVTRLGLEKYFSAIFCRQRSETRHPKHDSILELSPNIASKVHELSHHQRKPDRTVLLEICSFMKVSPQASLYIGDSIARDVLMAKRAEVFAVWAAYGSQHNRDQYEQLVRISHWTTEDVQRERQIAEEAKMVEPDFIAKRGYFEVLDVF